MSNPQEDRIEDLEKENFQLRWQMASDTANVHRILKWWANGYPEKPANIAFTAGPNRTIGYMLEHAAATRKETVMSEKFWMVWKKDGNLPRVAHRTKQAAMNEAIRLYGLYPDDIFYVLETALKIEPSIPPMRVTDLNSGTSTVELPRKNATIPF